MKGYNLYINDCHLFSVDESWPRFILDVKHAINHFDVFKHSMFMISMMMNAAVLICSQKKIFQEKKNIYQV